MVEIAQLGEQINTRHITESIMKEKKILPDSKMFRWMHPAAVCGIENGMVLLRGNRANSTNVIDGYGSQERERAARNLEDPGLNFTKVPVPTYESKIRRMQVSLSVADQPEALRIYPDVGSQVHALYFTLPEDVLFRVHAEQYDPREVGTALVMRTYMDQLGLTEEPKYLDWLQEGKGVRVITYLPGKGGKEQRMEIRFVRENSAYKVENAAPQAPELDEALEQIALCLFFMENDTFDTVTMLNGTMYNADDLHQHIMENPAYSLAKQLETNS